MVNENRSEKDILSAIKATDFSIHNKDWERYNGSINHFGRIGFSGGSGGGYRAVYALLLEKMSQ